MLLGENSANFAVNGGQGRMTLPTAGAIRGVGLNDLAAGDVEAIVDLTSDTAPTGSGVHPALLVRRVGTSVYRLRFKAQPAPPSSS